MKNALFLVDIQNDYFEGGECPVANMRQADANAAHLLSNARGKQEMIDHIHHEMPTGGPFFVT